MDYRAMCIQQGYVPPTCQMDGQLCWLRVQEGKDPCEGCNYNRAKCNGRHTPYESDSYKLGVFVDAVLEAQRKREYELKLAEDRQIADRQHKHSMCHAKVILSINTETNHRGQLEIELKVNDLISERGYIKRFNSLEEARIGTYRNPERNTEKTKN